MILGERTRIFVAGHRGMVGSAIWRALERRGCRALLGRTRSELDLRDGGAVREFYDRERPEYVVVAAAKVGGIEANRTLPVDFLQQNLEIQTHVISNAHRYGVRKLLFLGSSCIYPKFAPQPLKEEHLLTGALEPTNEWYAIAKIAGIKLCQAYRRQHGCDFISAMPTNLYGQNDNYDPAHSHVLPALIRKFHEARIRDTETVTCWGTGTPRREFLHADDLAEACVTLLERYSEELFINVGSGSDISIRELSELVAGIVGFRGRILWDESKPDGTPRKWMDSSRIFALGWKPRYGLEGGIRHAYSDFLARFGNESRAA